MNHELYPIPHSTSEHTEFGVTIGVERAPASVIKDIKVNKAARDILSREDTYLATEDFFRENIWMSTGIPEKNILTAYSSGRVVPIAYWDTAISMGYAAGGVLTGKGSWVAGNRFTDVNEHATSSVNFHTGLLSVSGARSDISMSNRLIHAGYRAALHLGYVVFDQNKLHSWLMDRWRGNTNQLKVIEESFRQVRANGGPAYLFRIGGTTERYSNVACAQTPLPRMKGEMMRAARLMLLERDMADSQIARALNIMDDHHVPFAISALTQMAGGKTITEYEYIGYIHLTAALYGQNTIAAEHATGIPFLTPVFDTDYLSFGKDIDLAHFTYDFDEASGRLSTPRTNHYHQSHRLDRESDGYLTNISRIFAKNIDESSILYSTAFDKRGIIEDYASRV